MPAISHYNPDETAIRVRADEELATRRARMNRIRAYYEGEHPPQLTDLRDNVVLNICKQVVDETVAFLVPDMPRFELDTDPDSKNDREKWLHRAWDENGGAMLVHQMALNGALTGHVFARIVPNTPYPRVINLNPANLLVWWGADDYQTVHAYEIRWEDGQNRYRQDIYKEEGSWIIADYAQNHPKSGRKIGAWERLSATSLPYCPIVSWSHLPNANAHYGRDELGALVGLNGHINKVASDIKSILRYHAYPTTVGTGFSAKDVQETRIDGFLTIPDKEARVFNVEMQSDLASSLALLDRLEAHLLGISRVVLSRGGVDAFRGMTNLAVRTAYLPMIHKNEQLRRAYGWGLRQLSRLMLDFCPVPAADDERISLYWSDPLPTSRADELTGLLREYKEGLIDEDTLKRRVEG
ncbi:MAG: phage portal protein [Anaerolineae bacterium]|nr:phage portal protein [Anaerolineae bacterium]